MWDHAASTNCALKGGSAVWIAVFILKFHLNYTISQNVCDNRGLPTCMLSVRLML